MNEINKPIFITEPLLPDLNSLNLEIMEIFRSKWVTNHGQKHNLFKKN